MAFVVTVSQINRRLALLIKDDKQIQNISVKGELSNFVEHFKSGHMYFTLRDGDASIKGVMFKSYAEKLRFDPENGMNVIVTGSVQLYERDGICQIYAVDMERDEGIGEGADSFEQIKQKLLKEGLFEQKRPLPEVPKSICVVTSETGAAIKDILNVLSRRYPFVKVKLVPVLVQGTDAPMSVAKGMETAQKSGCDVIIFGRGGGSSEDLSAFNTEVVARAVFASKIPTISAVGHEIDYSISDFVADMRAPTPSAAAEIAVPDITVIKKSIEEQKDRIREKVFSKIEEAQSKVNSAMSAISFYNPKNRIKLNENALNGLSASIKKNFSSLITVKELRLKNTEELINAYNPLKILERGYSAVYKDGSLITSSNSVKKGDEITVKLSDGEFNAVVS